MAVSHLPLLGPDGTPSTLAPISAATVVGDLVVVSGQAAVDLATGAVVGATVQEQAEVVLEQLVAVLARAGATPADVLRAECFLARAEDFAAFNAVYARWFPPPSPARTTVVCGFAIPGMLVEVQALAVRSGGT
ncbi:RidA family protein [Patulibacter sp. NPDC049589]|uniref:RidA family protein n=1 Tax=Patulibacter sp. NPDC049589 TaxID=3154731 RepID=UPI003435F892